MVLYMHGTNAHHHQQQQVVQPDALMYFNHACARVGSQAAMDGQVTRRESRIPKLPAAASGRPLAEKVRCAWELLQQQVDILTRVALLPSCVPAVCPVAQLHGFSTIMCILMSRTRTSKQHDVCAWSQHEIRNACTLCIPLLIQSNIMERKRRGAPLEGIPEAKRPTRGASATSAAAVAPGAAEAAAPKPEESWEDIADRTGMSVEDLLTKKLTFKKGTLPAKKLEEMGPMIKELK